MDSLKTRSVHKHKLGTALGTHTCYAMARSLGFARSDTDFLTHQSVEQSRFTHIGLANNSDQTTSLVIRRDQHGARHHTLAFTSIEHSVDVVCALWRGVR